MKNSSLVVVIILIIGLAGAAVAQDKNPICQNAIPPAIPFDDDTNCKYRGKIHMGPSGGSPYKYDEKGSPQGLLPPGYVTCTFFFYVCGDQFFKGREINVNAGEKCPDWQLEYREICCDKWEEAKRTKQPCDVTLDADCDGMPNAEDDRPAQAPESNAAAVITKSAGFIFISPRSGRAVGRQGPDDSCSEVGFMLTGSKLVYRYVVLNKDTGKPDWYFAEVPGAVPGWIHASDTTPYSPPSPSTLPPGSVRGGPIAGSRGRPNTSSGNRRGTRRSGPKRTSKRP